MESFIDKRRLQIIIREKRAKTSSKNTFFQKRKPDCCIKIGEMNHHCHKAKLIAQSKAIWRLDQDWEMEKGTNIMFFLFTIIQLL